MSLSLLRFCFEPNMSYPPLQEGFFRIYLKYPLYEDVRLDDGYGYEQDDNSFVDICLEWSNEKKRISHFLTNRTLVPRENFEPSDIYEFRPDQYLLRNLFFEYLGSRYPFFQKTGDEEPTLVSFCSQDLVKENFSETDLENKSNRFTCYSFESSCGSKNFYSYVYFVFDYVAITELLHKMRLDYSSLEVDFVLRPGDLCVVYRDENYTFFDIDTMNYGETGAGDESGNINDSDNTTFKVFPTENDGYTPSYYTEIDADIVLYDELVLSLDSTRSVFYDVSMSFCRISFRDLYSTGNTFPDDTHPFITHLTNKQFNPRIDIVNNYCGSCG